MYKMTLIRLAILTELRLVMDGQTDTVPQLIPCEYSVMLEKIPVHYENDVKT